MTILLYSAGAGRLCGDDLEQQVLGAFERRGNLEGRERLCSRFTQLSSQHERLGQIGVR